jgi:DGQHR domain-containing protein
MPFKFPAIELQVDPRILVATIPGRWLLERTTPSWRIQEPIHGFQRMVNERRAREIAATVLTQQRTFPNAIVLATDSSKVGLDSGEIIIPTSTRFLVVDGQHRLWAQQFSEYDALYACIVHTGLSEREMASLFLEINDNQKRVPSSLRWDLVRLVQPESDPAAVRTADLIYDLTTEKTSPLFQRVDLTGEQPEITLKQGSLAPEIKSLVGSKLPIRDEPYELQLKILTSYFAAIRERDADGWEEADGPLYKARVLRALLRILPEILRRIGKPLAQVESWDLAIFINRVNPSSLSDDQIRSQQGNAGIAAITAMLKIEILGEE